MRLFRRSILLLFSCKTEAIGDKQHYYKIIEIGMDQFGLQRNFLGILQVSAINFILKIIFLNYLSFLLTSGLRARNLESAGASVKDSPDSEHNHPELRVYLY
jgi:hypothetical protein